MLAILPGIELTPFTILLLKSDAAFWPFAPNCDAKLVAFDIQLDKNDHTRPGNADNVLPTRVTN